MRVCRRWISELQLVLLEEALDRGGRLMDVVSVVARDCAMDRALLTRRWVQFTTRERASRNAVIGSIALAKSKAAQQIIGGTAFISDVGMTGPYDSILGRRIDRVLTTTLTFLPTPFDVAEKDVRLGGAIVEIDAATGRASAIRRVMIDEAAARQTGTVNG